MYGAGDSALHRGLGTDRLVVAWSLLDEDPSSEVALARREEAVGRVAAGAPVLSGAALPGDGAEPEYARIVIPSDIHAVLAADAVAAARWREETRAAWEWVLARGYGVVGVGRAAGSAQYVVRRE